MKPQVLIVDDSLTVRMDLADALLAAGFEVQLSGDLRGAREALARSRLGLVILDVLLPDGSGIDLLRELKADPARASIPVMLLSTEAEVRSRIAGMQAGADEYVGKPYDLGQVVARARALVQRSPARPAAPPRRRVLVIDDSQTFRHELAEALEHVGYDVHEAATGEEGLVLAAAIQPHAVVVDGVLPGIDGATVVRRLKSDASLRRVPCLLMTAADETADELRSLEAGADAYVRKSENLELVLVRLAALLRSGVTGGVEAGPSLLGPKRLLAVDDSLTYLQALGEQLRLEGYDVVMATSGEEALELLESQAVDCILLDRMMPGLSGEDTCRRIKQSPRWRELPLVMLTSRDDREAMIEGINAGADDYIAKSADFDVLKARLRAQLRRKHFEDENRRIREQLVRRETEARFQRLLHSNIIGVILIGLDGVLRDANDAFLIMIGASRDELTAGALRWDAPVPLEWRETPTPVGTELVRRDGSRIPVLVGIAALEGSDTSVGFVLDRTEQRHAEERLERYARAVEHTNRELADAKERAETESRFKSRFLASMSHELRTPLNSIIGFSELLEAELFGPLNPRQKEYAHNVLASGRHLLSLVNDILDLSKIAAGRMQLSRDWTPLSSVIESVEGMVHSLVARGGLAFSISAPENLPDLYVDAVRIRQILFNLLSNAIKFTRPGGSVELIVTAGEKYLEVACRDTGIGMRTEDLPRLFREFEQLEQHGAEPTQGTGLGLALTRKLVELHGGEIRVTSAPGEGSTFTFTLPMLRRGLAAEPSDGTAAAPAETVVLVVEDDPHAAELIGGHLRAAGLSIAVARHADEAVRLAVQLRPAAITLDILMPGPDGWALLGRLKQDPATRDIPVVVVSIVDEPGHGLVMGATDYLVKPVSRDVLLDSLEAAGVPVHRVAGLRVLLAGPGNGDLDGVEAHLRQAGCEVRRTAALTPALLSSADPVDLVLVNLAEDMVGGMTAIEGLDLEDTALPVPVVALVDGELPPGADPRGELIQLARGDALTPERLVRVVRTALDRRQPGGSSWHLETGLPSPLSLRAHLRGVIQRSARELERVALVMARVPLPGEPSSAPWPRLLRAHVRRGDYVAVAGDDAVAMVVYGSPEADGDRLVRRLTDVLAQVVGATVTAARSFFHPDDGDTADDLLGRALSWAESGGS